MLDSEDEVCTILRNADYYVEVGGASYPGRFDKKRHHSKNLKFLSADLCVIS
jgi:hypothetical protein